MTLPSNPTDPVDLGGVTRAEVSGNKNDTLTITFLDPVQSYWGLGNSGRLDIDLFTLANEVEDYIAKIKVPIKVSVLGCAVNGPGEASEADIGIAAGKGVAILYRKGEVIKRIKEEEIVSTVLEEVEKFQPS